MKKPLLVLLLSVFFLSGWSQELNDTISSLTEVDIPVFSLTEMSVEENGQSQEISGLLQSSSDIFVSTAGYTFGPARYRLRGYDSENLSVLMNGIPMNDPESGRAYWSSWGGLNDVTRNKTVLTGVVASELGFGGVAGITDINTRPSSFGKRWSLSYSLSNRSYNNRAMVTYSSGLNDKGWAFVASGSRRWSQTGYVEGTYYDAYSYFLGVEKKINSVHSLSLTVFAAPTKRGRAGVSTQEAYDLSGSNYYNPYWGYQNGEVRNARVSQYNQPMITLTHYCDISKNTKAQGSVAYWFGRGGSTALDWAEAGDPRPDYYRNLPSYWESIGDGAMADYLTEQWKYNESFRQINFDAMYFANSKFLTTIDNADGIEGNTVTGNRAKYIIEGRRNDKSQILVNWHINSSINDHLDVSGGVNISLYKGRHYNVVDDLMGADFWLDIDKYADGEPAVITEQQQNDLNHPNKVAYVGDVIGNDYTANVNTYEGFGQAFWKYNKVDFYAAFNITQTTFWRTGHMRNGRFPDNSYGNSVKNNFLNYGVKGGITYKLNGRNYITGNLLYATKAPEFWNSYISARTRDFTVPDLKSESVYSGDLNYVLRTPTVKARLTVFYTQFSDQTWTRSFYHDGLNTFVNYSMTGVDKRNTGMEFGIEAAVSPTITLTGVAGKGLFIYNSRPTATISRDNDAEIMATDRTVYLKNYYVGGSPQTVASAGIKYSSPKYWFISINANYMADNYLDINPDRRTEEALAGFYDDDLRIEETLAQEKLDPGFTVDVFGGKSWRIDYKYTMGFTLSVSNLLNNTDYAMSGFEQLRYDTQNINKFPPKYFYLYGRTFFLNLYFRF